MQLYGTHITYVLLRYERSGRQLSIAWANLDQLVRKTSNEWTGAFQSVSSSPGAGARLLAGRWAPAAEHTEGGGGGGAKDTLSYHITKICREALG